MLQFSVQLWNEIFNSRSSMCPMPHSLWTPSLKARVVLFSACLAWVCQSPGCLIRNTWGREASKDITGTHPVANLASLQHGPFNCTLISYQWQIYCKTHFSLLCVFFSVCCKVIWLKYFWLKILNIWKWITFIF